MSSHKFLFYAPELEHYGDQVSIAEEEHHHLVKVLRLDEGDMIHVTNGRGLIVSAYLDKVGKSFARALVSDVISDEPVPRVALALSLMRKERFAQAVEQCVELGISEVLPFLSEHVQVDRLGYGSVERLQRIAISAMKQSFQGYLPSISEPVMFEALIARVHQAGNSFFGDQEGEPLPLEIRGDALVIVGPEAGFSEEEANALVATGARPVSISRNRLRSETAAVALVAAAARAIDSTGNPT